MENMIDPHHCRCFSINPDDIEKIKHQLENLGFYQELEEDHGQVIGRVLRIEDKLQLHVKVMKNGLIEGEMEPPVSYPGAHLNPEHSYSAHQQIEEILFQYTAMPYTITEHIPFTCLNPLIKKPHNPTHVKTIAKIGLVGIGIAALLHYLSKDDEEGLE